MAFQLKAVEQYLAVYCIVYVIFYGIVYYDMHGGHSYGSFFSVPLFKILYKVHLVSTFLSLWMG